MMVKDDKKMVERVGGYELRIVRAEETAESRRRWEQRGVALAAWLLAEWKRECRETK